MKHIAKILILLLAGAFAACTPDCDIAGAAWNCICTATDEDGDNYRATHTMVLNGDKTGMLFVNVDYDEPMTFCFAMPLSYTWDDNQGSATATWSHPEAGTHTMVIPLSYAKTTGLTADFLNVDNLLDIQHACGSLEKTGFSKPGTMEGSVWTMDITDEDDNLSYHYELHFISTTTGLLTLTMTEGNEGSESERWNVNYTYRDGVGATSMYFDGMHIAGGFYMPDDSHLLFSDGENGLMLTAVR